MRLHCTVEEAARIFEVSEVTIREWIAKGQLATAPRVGRKHRILIADVAQKLGISPQQALAAIESSEPDNGPIGILRNNRISQVAIPA